MSKRRVTTLIALAGLLDLSLAGGCHTGGHGCCWLRDEEAGRTRVCDLQEGCCPESAAIAYDPVVPDTATLHPAYEPPVQPTPAPATTEPDFPVVDTEPIESAPVEEPREEEPRDPVIVDKPQGQPWDFEEPVFENPAKTAQPADPEWLDQELPPPALSETEPDSAAPSLDPVPATPANPEPVAATDTLTLLKNLGAVIKFDKTRDPFGDKETIESVVGLDLSSAQITDAELKLLSGMSNLQELDLTGTPVTDDGLKSLRHFDRLELLWLNGTKVSDSGLDLVSKMKELKSLGLANTTVGDAGISQLTSLKKLEYLLLAQTQVTDEGLEQLPSLGNLKGLSLMGAQVTPQGVKKLRKALPNCQVVYNTKKETSSLPLFQRRPFGWFPHLISSNNSEQVAGPVESAPVHHPAELEASEESLELAEPWDAPVAELRPVANDPRTVESAAKVCMAEERWEDAIVILEPAVESFPNDVLLQYRFAVALGRAGYIEDAMPHFIQTVGEAEAHYNIGVILYETGRLSESEKHLSKALQLKPELSVAREQLEELRRETEAEEHPVKQTAFFRKLMFRP